tara:strand:+ start:1477 stop:2040 length:564 start_codon:yes stop_codon:yes gene_type:complete
MSIDVFVGDKAVRKHNNQFNKIEFKLDIRKTLGGDYVIYDHEEMDIVVSPKTKKIVAFAKDSISEMVYDTQSRFFDFLTKKGVISRDSVQAGNVYASMQGKLEAAGSEDIDPVQVAIYSIAKFVEDERPKYEFLKQIEKEEEEMLTDPTDEEATELGEVPHAREKGSIRPGIYYQAYMNNRFYGMHE